MKRNEYKKICSANSISSVVEGEKKRSTYWLNVGSVATCFSLRTITVSSIFGRAENNWLILLGRLCSVYISLNSSFICRGPEAEKPERID